MSTNGRCGKKRKLPADAVLIPGVISHATNIVEHPELVSQRIVRLANLVGRENVIASTDCGFAQVTYFARVHPQIMWAKLEALVQGAARASKLLWPRAAKRAVGQIQGGQTCGRRPNQAPRRAVALSPLVPADADPARNAWKIRTGCPLARGRAGIEPYRTPTGPSDSYSRSDTLPLTNSSATSLAPWALRSR